MHCQRLTYTRFNSAQAVECSLEFVNLAIESVNAWVTIIAFFPSCNSESSSAVETFNHSTDVFHWFIALQLRSLQLQTLGLIIMAIAVPVCFFILIISAFTSQSRDGRLVVEENEAFSIAKTILFWCVMNFIALAILNIRRELWTVY